MEYVPAGTLEALIERARTVPRHEQSGRMVLDVVDAALEKRGETPPLDSMLRAQLERATWPEAVCILGAQLGIALDYAHTQQVLHRDVKPANVLLAATGRPKLADFNISYSAALEVATAEEYMGGSLPYMSPEQLEIVSPFHDREASRLDARSDVYGLGVVLWELLTGKIPFPEPEDGQGWSVLFTHMLETRQQGVPAEELDALPGTVPSMVVETLRACLAADPNARPQTGADLARRLELCLDPQLRTLLSDAGPKPIRTARRRPLLALIVMVLVPNVALSVLNILYNVRVVVSPDQVDGFFQQVQVVNGIAFPLGITICLWFSMPIIKALRGRTRGDLDTAEARAAARLRATRLGGALAAVLLPLWTVAGFAFPIWRRMQQGEATEGAYFHFMMSHVMFGLLSATVCYFLANWLMTRVAIPLLITPGDVDEPCVQAMRRQRRRLVAYFAGCVAVPFVSIVLLATRTEAMKEAMQSTWLVLGLMGAGAFGLSLVLSRRITANLRALERGLAPRKDRFRPLV